MDLYSDNNIDFVFVKEFACFAVLCDSVRE